MKQIELTKGKWAVVDDCDYEWINSFNWCCDAARSGFYAARLGRKSDGAQNRKRILMHRQIMDCPESMFIDHIDGNGLNNQRANLRICTNSENCRNRGISRNNKSGFKGVYPNKSTLRPWAAYVSVNGGGVKYIGSYKTKEEAATAYNKHALIHHGNFAKLNDLTLKLAS